jgi:putative redox protein
MGATRTAVVRLTEAMTFEAVSGSGHRVVLDAAPEVGGRERGMRPMEMLLAALGGCTGMDVISILRKMRQDVTAYEVRVSGVRRDEHPRIYTEIHVEHVVTGPNLSEQNVRRAVELSSTTYCPVSAMLQQAARVTHRYRLVKAGEGS